MYPDLSYFFHDLLGTAPDNWTAIFKTFGLFLGAAIFTSAFIMYKEFQRKEAEGVLKPYTQTIKINAGIDWKEVLISAFMGFAIGYKFMYVRENFENFKVDPSEILFSGGGNLLLGLLLAAVFGGFSYWSANKNKSDTPQEKEKTIYPSQKVADITIVAMISGLFGAKIFSIAENVGWAFFEDPIGHLFSGSGLTVYGSLIIGALGVWLYLKKLKIPFVHFLDSCSPAFIAGYGVGRIGCHLSGDGDWGIVNTAAKPDWFILPDWAWSYTYPRNVLERGTPVEDCVGRICNQLPEGVFPTPIYEILMSIAIVMILLSLRKRLKIAGAMFFAFCIFNGLERFLIEKIRVNDTYNYFGFEWSQAQYIAIGLMLVGILGLIYLYFIKPKKVVT